MQMTVEHRRELVTQILQETYNWSLSGTVNEREMIIASLDRYLDRYIRNAISELPPSMPLILSGSV